MAASAIIAAIGLAVAIGSTVYGISQQNKAKQLKASNERPKYDITPYQKENQQLAENLATQGLPESTLNYYRQQSERGLSYGVGAILKGGGDNNQIGGLYANYNDSMTRLAVLDDQRRLSNLAVLREQNRAMSNEADKQWQVNQWGPFADRAQEAQALYNSGSQYISQGISTGVNAIGNYASNQGQQRQINQVNNGSGMRVSNPNGGMSTDPGVGLMQTPYAQQYMYQPSNTYNYDKLTPLQQSYISGLYQR